MSRDPITTLIGYDCRQRAEAYCARTWQAPRRELFLLRPETAWPKSVDRMVWPSLFLFPFDYRGPGSEVGTAPAEPEDHRMRCLGLWADPAPMRAALRRAGGDAAGVELRIELLTHAPVAQHEFWGVAVDLPARGEAGWSPIGYDVADAAYISGLSNCGYRGEEAAELRADWGGKLNDHGLFRDAEDAHAFCAVMDRRIEEHAPFWVFGLSERDQSLVHQR